MGERESNTGLEAGWCALFREIRGWGRNGENKGTARVRWSKSGDRYQGALLTAFVPPLSSLVCSFVDLLSRSTRSTSLRLPVSPLIFT